MRILVDCVPYDNGHSGISVYMNNVVAELAKQGHELTLFVEPESAAHFAAYPCLLLPDWTKRAVISMLYHLLILPFRVWRIRKQFDLFILCAANRRVLLFYPIRTVAVVHDLAPCRVKGKYDPFRTFYQHRIVPFFAKRARFLFAISKCTAADMVTFWKLRPNRIKIDYNGLVTHPAGPEDFLHKFNLEDRKYVLYVSRLEHPGKNQSGLIRAFGQLPEELRSQYRLVLAGAFWNEENLLRDLAARSPASNQIVFTGFLTDFELTSAYRHAAMYIFPSFYEGFGLSLLEAMNAGLPCACSETSSLGEIGHGAAILFDPASDREICDAMRNILTDGDLRERLAAQGRSRAGEFTWARHVRMLANAASPKVRAHHS